MLDAFTRHIATNTDIAATLANLVGFININDSLLTVFQILSTFQIQLEQDGFDIFANVALPGPAQ